MTFSTPEDQQELQPEPGFGYRHRPAPGDTQRHGGGGTVYVFWRHFFDPDTIIMTKTLDYGIKWTNPKSIIGQGSIAAFDQPTIPSNAYYDPSTLTARSNGFPTATVTADGTVFAAWQERVNTTADEFDLAFGRPDPPARRGSC